MAGDSPVHGGGPSRRELLAASAVAGGAVWLLRGLVRPDGAYAADAPPAPPGFPAGPDLHRRVYENWAGEIRTDRLWTCVPRHPQDVLDVVNWAYGAGWTVRAQGKRHGWAPLTVADGTPAATRVVLLDTTAHLTAMSLERRAADGSAGIRVQTGATLEDLLAFAGAAGHGVTAAPAPGQLSVGGALAIGAHGTAVPAAGESPPPGHGYGSLSNLVTELIAVVWDEDTGRHVLRTVGRAEPDCDALLTHLGRSLVTEAARGRRPEPALPVPPGHPGRRTVRCPRRRGREADPDPLRRPDRPGGSGLVRLHRQALAEGLERRSATAAGLPRGRRAVQLPVLRLPPRAGGPAGRVPGLGGLLSGARASAPLFGRVQYLLAKVALTGDITDVLLSDDLVREVLTGDVLTHLLAGGLRSDLWGPSRHLLQYIRPTTLRETANGYAVLVRRAGLQWVVSRFADFYRTLLAEYAARGEYPVNGQVEIRVTGLEDPSVCGVPGARPPLLSALRPRPDRPDADTAVWIDILSLPATPALHRFYRETEQFLFALDGDRATVRAEWSEG